MYWCFYKLPKAALADVSCMEFVKNATYWKKHPKINLNVYITLFCKTFFKVGFVSLCKIS